MKKISTFDQFLTLREGINLDQEGLKINVIRDSDSSNDDFIINRSKAYFKKMFRKIPIYFGFQPNPAKGFSESRITQIYNGIKVKDASEIAYEEDLRKLIILTSPDSMRFDKIIIPESSSVLNFVVAKNLARKYGNLPESNIYVIPKIEYFPADMIDKEKYEKSDAVTKDIVDAWFKCVNNKFKDTQVVIKKSGYNGECGLKSGGRRLLNPVYSIPKIFTKRDKILIVDDFIVTGTSVAEIARNLIEDGVPADNIYAYILGIKKFSKEVEEESSQTFQ